MTTHETALELWEPNPQEMDIYRKHYAPPETTQDEWNIFLEVCKTYRISPLRKQIYLIGRYDPGKGRTIHTPQVSIGTLRLLALRSREFEGTTEPEWGDEEGHYHTLWPKRLGASPYAARIGVYRKGFRVPKWGVAYFHELAQRKTNGELTKFWNTMGIHMILKCAEADALRGAFEEDCGGIYLHEEMNQADIDARVISIIPEDGPEENEALHETRSHAVSSQKPQGSQRVPVSTDMLKARLKELTKDLTSDEKNRIGEYRIFYGVPTKVSLWAFEDYQRAVELTTVWLDKQPQTDDQQEKIKSLQGILNKVHFNEVVGRLCGVAVMKMNPAQTQFLLEVVQREVPFYLAANVFDPSYSWLMTNYQVNSPLDLILPHPKEVLLKEAKETYLTYLRRVYQSWNTEKDGAIPDTSLGTYREHVYTVLFAEPVNAVGA